MNNLDPAQITAMITALAGLVTAVGAVLHSIHTKNTVTARSQQAAQDFLTSDDTRAALGRQVRSTAKDALQDLTEAAGQPFVIPPAEPTSSAPSMLPPAWARASQGWQAAHPGVGLPMPDSPDPGWCADSRCQYSGTISTPHPRQPGCIQEQDDQGEQAAINQQAAEGREV